MAVLSRLRSLPSNCVRTRTCVCMGGCVYNGLCYLQNMNRLSLDTKVSSLLSITKHKHTNTHTYILHVNVGSIRLLRGTSLALIITFVAVLCSFVCLFSFVPRQLLSIFVCCLLVFFPRFVFFPLLRCTYCSSCCCRGLYEAVDWPVISVSLTSEVT